MFFLVRPSAIPSRVTRCYVPGNVNDLGQPMLGSGSNETGAPLPISGRPDPPLWCRECQKPFHGTRIFDFLKHFLRLICEDVVSGGREPCPQFVGCLSFLCLSYN